MSSWEQFQVAPDSSCHTWNGAPVYLARFDQVLKFHFPGLAPAKDKTGAFHIDVQGAPVYAQRYDDAFGFYQKKAAVRSGSSWFHILTTGGRLSESAYAWCGNFQEDRCAVRDFDGRYFHIDPQGEPAYEEKYAYAGDFHDGLAMVQNDAGFHTHIDKNGHLVHEKYFLDLDVYHKGYARARDSSGWFHIDKAGSPLYSHRFTAVEPFYNGQARVETFDGGLHIIDPSGSLLQILREPRTTPFQQAAGELVGYWRTLAIDAAVRLGVFETYPHGPAPRRLVRALTELGLVDAGSLTEKGKVFRRDHPLSLSAAVRMWSEEHLSAWRELVYSLETGKPGFEKISGGQEWFDWIGQSGESTAAYHQAIASYARFDYAALANAIDFTGHAHLIDVGGSQGILSLILKKTYPHLRITLLDRPEVLHPIPTLELAPRDFFKPWDLSADAIILARVLHDWSDDEALRILQNARASLEDKGIIYVLEMHLNEETGSGALLDLNMLVMTHGRERTAAEFQQLFTAAGLQLFEVRPLNPVISIMILYRSA